MKLTLTTISLSLSLLPLAIAAGTCSSSGALAWPPVGDCPKTDKYGTIALNCRACCVVDVKCFQTCAKNAGLRKRDTIGEQYFGTIREKRDVNSRAVALSCVGVEGCYKYSDGSLLCLNLATGAYHDDAGGNGDYYTGVYTNADGRVQTGTSSATGTAGSKASSSSSRATSVSGSTGSTTRAVGITSAAAASASSAAASATSRAAGDALRIGANVGFVGVVAGLIL